MQHNSTQTSTIQYSNNAHLVQDIKPDYTGIYAFCGTVFIISMITLIVIHKISEKWRIDNYRLKQLAIEKTGEENIKLLKKLDKVLEILINGNNDDNK